VTSPRLRGEKSVASIQVGKLTHSKFGSAFLRKRKMKKKRKNTLIAS
jgi:hypothetical protein